MGGRNYVRMPKHLGPQTIELIVQGGVSSLI